MFFEEATNHPPFPKSIYLSFFLGLMLEVCPQLFFLQLVALGWSLA